MLGRSGWWSLLVLSSGCDRDFIIAEREIDAKVEPAAAGEAEVPSRPALAARARAPGPLLPGPTCQGAPCAPAVPAFELKDPYRQRRSLRGDTQTAQNLSGSECASLGPDQRYELDLRAFAEPVAAYLQVRADFAASLSIEAGPLQDPFVLACNAGHGAGAPQAFLAVTLEPKLYRVVVDGRAPEDAGEFELIVELPPPGGRCNAPPPNDRCEQAIVIDPKRPVQTFFGTTECASDQAQANWECSNFEEREAEVFYSLDLSERTQPVLVHATTNLAPTNHDTRVFVARAAGGACAETLLCGDTYQALPAELWAALEPGHYLLAVEASGNTGDFGLSVEIAPEPCLVANDTCDTAQEIEPVLGVQSFSVWPGCGDDSIANGCTLDPSPDIFYHLDLRGFGAQVRVRALAMRGGVEYDSLALMSDTGESCGGTLRCGNFDLWLEPRSYYLALNGFRDQQGPVDFSVEISADGPPPRVDCIDEGVALCARADRAACCSGREDVCWLSLASCGLSARALACVCEADPGCCGAPGGSFECERLLGECGTFCPGFDPVLTCPG